MSEYTIRQLLADGTSEVNRVMNKRNGESL